MVLRDELPDNPVHERDELRRTGQGEQVTRAAVVVDVGEGLLDDVQQLRRALDQRHSRVHALEARVGRALALLLDPVDAGTVRGQQPVHHLQQPGGSAARLSAALPVHEQLELAEHLLGVLLLPLPQPQGVVAQHALPGRGGRRGHVGETRRNGTTRRTGRDTAQGERVEQAGGERAVGQVEELAAGHASDAAALRALLDSLGAGVYWVDEAGRITGANREAERLLGLPVADLLGRQGHEALHSRRPDGSTYPVAQCSLLAVLRTGVAAEQEDDAFVRADGSLLPVSWISAPVERDGEVAGAVVVFRSAQARQALERQRAQALAAERAEQARVRAAHERLELLSAATQVLTSTLDLDEAMTRLARLVVARLADWCVVDLLDDEGRLRRVALAHRDPSVVLDEARRPLPATAGSRAPLARVLGGSGALVLEDLASRPPADDELAGAQYELFRRLRAQRALVVPLVARRRVLGALTLAGLADGAAFPPDVRQLTEDLAGRAALAADNARLHAGQRQVAETLQRSLLTLLPQVDHIRIAARYLPASRHSQVGGDWYDSFLLPDGCTALVIGDVAGHDLEAAARMGQLRNLLRGLAVDRLGPPGDVLRRLDLAVEALGAADLATTIFGRVELVTADPPARRFVWSSAGHPPPLLVLPDGRTELLETDPDLPLGVVPGLERRDETVDLAPGCTLLLYTDGLVESREHTVQAGLLRLRQAAGRYASAPVEQFCDGVLEVLEGGRSGRDDVAVLALRVQLPEDDAPVVGGSEEARQAADATGSPAGSAATPAGGRA